MSTQLRITRGDFENVLTPDALRITQMVQFSLMAGPFFFAMVVILVSSRGTYGPPHESDPAFIETLSIVTMALTAAGFGLGQLLFNRTFSPSRILADSPSTPPEAIAAQCMSLQRTAILLRLATMEGAAFFGLVISMVAATSGVLSAAPVYWINLLPTVVLLLFGLSTFPSKDRLAMWFEKRCLDN